MLKIALKIVFNIIVGAALLLALPGVASAFWKYLITFKAVINLWPFVSGAAIGAIGGMITIRFLPWLSTFEHELTHVIAGLPFGMIPIGFTVTKDRGGEARVIGLTPALIYPFVKDFVTLAPYVLPTFTAIAAACRPIAGPQWQPWLDIIIGLTFGYHTLSTLHEIKDNFTLRTFISAGSNSLTRSDIATTGIIFSSIYIVVVGLALHGIILAVIVNGYGGIFKWATMVSGTLGAVLTNFAS